MDSTDKQPTPSTTDVMDSLEAAMTSGMTVTSRPLDPHRPHPRFTMYKSSGKSDESQEKRRRQILENQRNRRENFHNHARNLADGDFEEEMDEDDLDDEHYARPKRLLKSYKNQLMQSEWLVDISETFSTDWYMVPAPTARRALVVAGNGWTYNYSRHGRYVNRFRSLLPGGNFKTANAITLLDCLYSPESKTYYVLDVMMWGGHSYYDCETEFRFYWTQTKLQETDGIQVASKENAYAFKPLPRVDCTQEAMAAFMAGFDETVFPEKLDGLLFYHKKVHYLPGFTPLVGWLMPWMLPEMLNVPIKEEHSQGVPIDFVGTLKYVEDFKTNQKERLEKRKEEREARRRKRRSGEKNDTSMEEGVGEEGPNNNKEMKAETAENAETAPAEMPQMVE